MLRSGSALFKVWDHACEIHAVMTANLEDVANGLVSPLRL